MASVVLLVAAGLLLRALWRIQAVDPGFRAEGVLTLRTALPLPKYDSTARRAEFYRRVLEEVQALPGVTSAAYISFLPMAMGGGIWPVASGGEPERPPGDNTASLRFVTPGFFATLEIPLRTGPRRRRHRHDPTTPFVAVVSESFVRRYWPGPIRSAAASSSRLHEADRRRRGGRHHGARAGAHQRAAGLPAAHPGARTARSSSTRRRIWSSATSAAPATLVPAVRDIVRGVDPRAADLRRAAR